MSRINSFYKRASSKVTLSKSIKVGDLDINKDSYVVKLNNKEIFFPKKEFNLLYFLASNPKKVYSRDSLLRNLWGTDVHVVAVGHVRKIEKIGPDYIHVKERLNFLEEKFNRSVTFYNKLIKIEGL